MSRLVFKRPGLLSLASVLVVARIIQANPEGLVVQSGAASAAARGAQLNITASHNAFLNWQSFNIGAGETTTFIQPSASSVVWNRINEQNPSQIYGSLNANGIVVLMNPAGFYFGPGSFVSAAGLVVSTAPTAPVDSSAGLFWQFNGTPPKAGIVNYGQLNAGRAGSLFLIADHVENHGSLEAPGGSIGLICGQEVILSTRPDGRGLGASVRLPSGSVDNSGRLVADAGAIVMQAQVVNQNGMVQANSVRERNGVIELVAAEAVSLGSQSVLSARGDADGSSAGGQIKIKSDVQFTDLDSSKIVVAGGSLGGDGGSVEISAPMMAAVKSQIDGHASPGGTGGRLFIDPLNITLSYSGNGSVDSGSVDSGGAPQTGTLSLDVNSAFAGFSQITLQALNNITLAAGTMWDLETSTGLSAPGSLLKLEAGNNIAISAGAGIVAGQNWSVTLQAGRDFTTTDTVRSGSGSIAFSGSGSIQAQNGSIDMLAGNNITIAAGYARTVGGGSISARAVAGSINTGTKANGFLFQPTGYEVDPDLGGISTANGGSVRLTAGLDVISSLPAPGGVQSDGGSGAFGAAAGDVTISAGRDVAGHFVVRNGAGDIKAGRNAGAATKLLALSLVRGGWTVNAVGDILLQEVRNPNGIFNNVGFGSSVTQHYFDYAPDAFTTLVAGNSVQLRGTALPRYGGAFEQGITPIYPGTLNIVAGAGGVVLGNDVTLFPSPSGNLSITTTAGGSLTGMRPGDLTQLIMSDSSRAQYRALGDFGIADHAAAPLHANDSEPVQLNISGDMKGILLGAPKRTQIDVGGDMINSRFDGQNLHDSDVTSIRVTGDIVNRNEFTTVSLDDAPNYNVFDLIYPPLEAAVAGVQNQFTYFASTKQMVFQGRMTGDQLDGLLNLRVRTFDASGAPIIGADGEPATATAEFIGAAALRLLYANSQDVPLNPDTGYRLGGGGLFEFKARNLDLGATVGIVSQGPRGNSALAGYFTQGAKISLSLSGNLDMFSTKIASLNGGAIAIAADGSVNVGSRDFIGSDSSARGIFTVDASDVSVIARGDINVNGSRIAAYDGGNITVRSLQGNIDAGTGGSGSATVEKIYVNPVTRQMVTYAPTIPGSGILATTFPPPLDPAFPASLNSVGNILVETPRGSITASSGGVVQIPLNGVGAKAGTVTLRAGSKDDDGNVLYAGDIDASGSGVIGSTVKLEATGDIKGLVFARNNIDLSAVQNVNVTALAQGGVNVGAGGSVSGTIIGVGSVSASGAAINASLLSQNVSSGGGGSGQVGFTQGNAAGAASQGLQKDDTEKKLASAQPSAGDDELHKKNKALPRLSRTVGRVTVILPKP